MEPVEFNLYSWYLIAVLKTLYQKKIKLKNKIKAYELGTVFGFINLFGNHSGTQSERKADLLRNEKDQNVYALYNI